MSLLQKFSKESTNRDVYQKWVYLEQFFSEVGMKKGAVRSDRILHTKSKTYVHDEEHGMLHEVDHGTGGYRSFPYEGVNKVELRVDLEQKGLQKVFLYPHRFARRFLVGEGSGEKAECGVKLSFHFDGESAVSQLIIPLLDLPAEQGSEVFEQACDKGNLWVERTQWLMQGE